MAPLKTRIREKGMALAEMAMILPILVLISFGIIEYGWMFLKAQQVTSAAREGARTGAMADASDADATDAATAVMDSSGMAGNYTVAVSRTLDTLASGDVQETLTVTVTIGDYSTVALLSLPFLPLPGSLTSAVSMSKERF